jgi:hypothetical protein
MIGWVTCAVCRKPVDKIVQRYDLARQVQVFTVHCHGARETTELPDDLVVDLVSEPEAGVAFQTTKPPLAWISGGFVVQGGSMIVSRAQGNPTPRRAPTSSGLRHLPLRQLPDPLCQGVPLLHQRIQLVAHLRARQGGVGTDAVDRLGDVG